MSVRRTAFLLAQILLLHSFSTAAESLDIPDDAQRVTALRYPRSVEQLRLLEHQVQRVVAQAKPATVGILVGQGAGSGVIVSPDGLVLTAGHVIGKPGRKATILLTDGRRLSGKTLGANHEIDAGMVQIENPPADLAFLPIAESLPKTGEWVIATGQPGGVVNDRAPPVRLGRILTGDDDWVCTDCTLVGGDSGGPLINLRGEVLAVHSSIGPAIEHNFHIPVVEIHKNWDRLLASEIWGNSPDELVSTELRPLMGITGRTENGQCLITQVFPGLPAAGADIRPGDIVHRVNGDEITTFEEVSKKVLEKRPGQSMRLQISRGDKTLEVELVLAGVRVPAPKSNGNKSVPREEP